MKPLDLKKPVQTRDGRAARIICTNMNAARSLVALIKFYPDGLETTQEYLPTGKVTELTDDPCDLVNIVEVTYKYQSYNPSYSKDIGSIYIATATYPTLEAALRGRKIAGLHGTDGFILQIKYEDGMVSEHTVIPPSDWGVPLKARRE